MAKPQVFKEYDERPDVVGTVNKEPSLTRQSEKNDADINVILARYEKTGIIPVDQREALFLDVSQLDDYQTVLEHVRRTEEFFARLPATTRAAFDNSASVFLDQAVDPLQRGKLVELGLLEADASPKAAEAPAPKDAGAVPGTPQG